MPARALLAGCIIALSASAGAQSLRVPERPGPGIDPSFARGWLAPDYDRFGFANWHWRDAAGFAPSQRMQWSYSFGERSSLGMSFNGRDYEFDQRQMSLFGRYSLTPDWSLSAETLWREGTVTQRLPDLRIGVQRRF